MDRFNKCFGAAKPVIGMIHLPPLPGYSASPGIESVLDSALADYKKLADAGVDGVLIENEYDRPHRVRSAPETTAALTRITHEIVRLRRGPVTGCEILLHDGEASLAAASMAGAAFIRVDYFVDRMRRPEYGEFDIDPDALLQYRAAIDAEHILILADIQVKYAEMIEPRPLRESAAEAMAKGADAVVVSGTETGAAPCLADLREAAVGIPVLIGSGLDAGNAKELLAACDGAIVGTSIMSDHHVDAGKLAQLLGAVRSH